MARARRQAPSTARDVQVPRLERAEKRSADRGCARGAHLLLNEPPAVKPSRPSGEVELASAPKPPARKSQARRYG